MTQTTNGMVRYGDSFVDPETGEAMSIPEQARSSKQVDDEYRRELKQFQGFAADAEEGMSAFDVFQIVKRDIAKVVNYDGLPTVPLKDFVGKTIKVTGSVFRSVHSFKSKSVVDEHGEGVTMKGYDKLILKVSHILNNKGEWRVAETNDAEFTMMATSAGQPCNLFEHAMKAGLPPGDWPINPETGEQQSMTFKIFGSGNAVFLGPSEVE